jgi:hypothetical protein
MLLLLLPSTSFGFLDPQTFFFFVLTLVIVFWTFHAVKVMQTVVLFSVVRLSYANTRIV